MQILSMVSKAAIIAAVLAIIGAESLPARANLLTLPASSDMNFQGGALDPASLSLYGLVAQDGIYNSAANFPMSSIPSGATITAVTLHFQVSGYRNGNPDIVIISAYGRTGPFLPADSIVPTTPIDTFSSSGLGIGSFSLNFSPDSIAFLQSLVGSGQDLGIRFDSISGSGDSSALKSLETFGGPRLDITFLSPADLDGDGTVDSIDFAIFNSCKTRDGVPHNGTALCQQADFDHDNDVDGNDFGVFQRAYHKADSVVITPASVFASTYFGSQQVPVNLINNSGLDTSFGNVLGFTHATHPNAAGMWHAGAGQGIGGAAPVVANQYVVFNLGANYNLTRAYLWQMVQPNLLGRGLKQFRLLASSNPPNPADAANPPASYNLAGFFELVGTTTLDQATGPASDPDPAITQSFAATGAGNVRQVYLDVINCQSNLTNDYVGLAEIKFEGTRISAGP